MAEPRDIDRTAAATSRDRGFTATTEAVAAPDDEAAAARAYWSTETSQRRRYGTVYPYVAALTNVITDLEPERVFEFGCSAGRNLYALRRTAIDRGVQVPQLRGCDINADAVAEGRTEFGLADLEVGGEEVLQATPPGSVDLAFTVSVLDHIPTADRALGLLTDIVRHHLLLLEPQAGHQSGKVTGVTSGYHGDEPASPAPYSYLHNYDRLLLGRELVQRGEVALPTGPRNLGPSYRLRVLAKARPRWPALVAGALGGRPASVEGDDELAGRIRPLLVGHRPGSGRLHVAVDEAAAEQARASVHSRDVILADRLSAVRIINASDTPLEAIDVDGYLVVLRPPLAASGEGRVRSGRAARVTADAQLDDTLRTATLQHLATHDLPDRPHAALEADNLDHLVALVRAKLVADTAWQEDVRDRDRLAQQAAAGIRARATKAAGHRLAGLGLAALRRPATRAFTASHRAAPWWDEAAWSLAIALHRDGETTAAAALAEQARWTIDAAER